MGQSYDCVGVTVAGGQDVVKREGDFMLSHKIRSSYQPPSLGDTAQPA